MKRSIIIIVAVAFLTLCVSTAYADDVLDPTLDMPHQVAIDKDNDVSAAMLSKLLGTEWQFIAGSKAADALGGAGKWAGVFTKFLSILNVLAMAFAAASVMSHWGIAALETAHHGKTGGKTYNTFWTPVRHAFSFSLCVPVTGGGLSLLQAGIIAAISISINFANVMWDSLGSYMISHVQTGVIDNSAPFVDEESLSLIRPMFRAIVAQEVILAERPDDFAQVKEKALPDGNNARPLFYRSVQAAVGGKYAIVREPLQGTVNIYLTGTKRMGLGELGSISIPAPVRKTKNGKLENPDDFAQYTAMSGISEARAAAVIELWEGLRGWAQFYLSDPENGNRIYTDARYPRPEKDGLALARRYRDTVMNASEAHLATLRSQLGVQKMLKKAIDSDGTQSKLGWVSAGLMPYTFSQAQKRLDDLCFGGGATFVNTRKDYEISNVGDAANASIRGAYAWSSEALLQGRLYQSVDEEGDGAGAVNRLIAGIFLDSNNGNGITDNEGILAGTLAKFRQADPIVVISDFGRKCYGVAASVAAISIGSAALSWIPLVGDSLAAISTSSAITGLMYLAFALGVILYFLPPIAVLGAWIWALLKWALTIIYVLTGAPLWTVAHSAPEGPGFTGEHARQGYYILLDLTLRPALLTGGVVVSMAVWQVAADLYNTLLSKYLNGFTSFNGSGLIQELIFAAILFIIFGAIYLKIFTFCINTGPNLVMDMFGRRGAASLDSSDYDGQHITAASGLAVSKGIGAVSSAASGAVGGLKGGAALYSKAKGALQDKLSGGNGGVANMAPKQPE